MAATLGKNIMLEFALQYKFKSMHRKTHELFFSEILSVISSSKH
jgi:hypothetical protein